MNDLKVCLAEITDFEDIQKLFREMFEIFHQDQNVEYPYTENGKKYLLQRIEEKFAFVAKEKNETIGFLTGSINDAIEFKLYKKYGSIENMYIAESYRNKKVGTLLLQEFVDKCKNLGVNYIQTDSDANQNLMNFYTSNGFKITGINYLKKI